MRLIIAIFALTACLLFVGCNKPEDGNATTPDNKATTDGTEKKAAEPNKPGAKEAQGTTPAGTNPNMTKEQIDSRAGSATTTK